ncbi:DUF6020 family protein [Eubacterium limosum]|uniref:DUF6020 family protein n=1 Tax=Eubacterium limosum TaxID=1736 RepID=A0ABT5UYN5_EUBLI|nr:DUF6020 family protein [Eubacterium limosum]MCB6571875.1 DUF6020 family protein [Eubacterium limosum]MDE1472687.1 DUF6020 family protein [Eubacterium limosum]
MDKTKLFSFFKKNNFSFSLILSFFCIIVFTNLSIAGRYQIFYADSVLTILIYIALVALFCFFGKIINLNLLKHTIGFGIIFSFFLVVGCEFSENHTIEAITIKSFFLFCGFIFVITAALAIFLYFLPTLSHNLTNNKVNIYLEKILGYNYKTFFFILVFILLFWTSAFLALFPGNFVYDGPFQIYHYVLGDLTAHHPVIHTLLLSECVILGQWLFNSYSNGLAIYSVVQAIVLATSFSYCCCYMKKLKIPSILVLFAILYFALNPVIQILAFTTTKDTIFSALFLLYIILTIDLLFDPSKGVGLFGQLRYIIIVVLMCLFRNQGIYIFIFCTPFVILIAKNNKKKLLMTCIISLITVKIISSLFITVFGIQPGDSREMLSVPMQQLAKVANEKPESITEDECKSLNEIMPIDSIQNYVPEISDPIKNNFNTEQFKSNYCKYIKLWANLGKKNPIVYIDAFLYLSYGNWYVDDSPFWSSYVLTENHLDKNINVFNIERTSKFPEYEKFLIAVSTDMPQNKIPIISVFLNQAFPFWIFLFSVMSLIYIRQKAMFISLLPIFTYWGTLLLGPVISVRYSLPLIVCTPLMFSLIFVKNNYINDLEEK